MENIHFSDVPAGWALCFLHRCAMKTQCMRYQAALAVPAGQTTCLSVLPQALTEGGCQEMREVKTEQVAWGFSSLFDAVRHQDYAPMRRSIEQYLGSRYHYYRYHRGEYRLREAQQQWIRMLFRQYGYGHEVAFDHILTAYIFD